MIRHDISGRTTPRIAFFEFLKIDAMATSQQIIPGFEEMADVSKHNWRLREARNAPMPA
jgi:hypothetical protein